uniref:Phosphorylase b kinase regulatory subunit n=1 Tax=Echinostoma caproni TaxID=27848 RepID=A0A183AGQ7_9TREM
LGRPGYYRGVSSRYLPFITAALTLEFALISESRMRRLDQGNLIKLTAVVLIVEHSLIASYWEDGRLCADGAYQFTHAEPDPQLVYRATQIYNARAVRFGLDQSVTQLLLATKQSWWETGTYVHRSRPHLAPTYLREAIRSCGLDESCDEHLSIVDCIGRWASTLKILSLLGIRTRDHLSLWSASKLLVSNKLQRTLCPAGNPVLSFCMITFHIVENSVVWGTDELVDIVRRTFAVHNHICGARSAAYHASAAYLTGETEDMHELAPPGSLLLAVHLIQRCLPENKCLNVRSFSWFQLVSKQPLDSNIQITGVIDVSEEAENTLERLGNEIGAMENPLGFCFIDVMR